MYFDLIADIEKDIENVSSIQSRLLGISAIEASNVNRTLQATICCNFTDNSFAFISRKLYKLH